MTGILLTITLLAIATCWMCLSPRIRISRTGQRAGCLMVVITAVLLIALLLCE